MLNRYNPFIKVNTAVIFVICLLFIVSSCKKSGGSAPVQTTSISATVDGVDVSFNVNAKGVIGENSTILTISGETAASGARTSIQMTMEPNTANFIGTYLQTNAVNSAGLAFLFYDTISFDSGSKLDSSDGNGSTNVTATITSMSKTNAQGTFSSIVKFNGDSTHTITNGKFNVALVTN